MTEIPVTFTFDGKEYQGTLDEVPGGGSGIGNFWHLVVDDYYWGQFHYYTERGFVFDAQNNAKAMEYLGGEFGEAVMLWYG